MRRTLLFLGAFIAGLVSSSVGQTGKLIVLEHADSLVTRVEDGQSSRHFVGNVRLLQDRVRVTCDRAIQFQETGNIQLLGNVVVVDDSVTMKFPRGMFYRVERLAVAYDSVQLDDGKVILTAKYGEYRVDPKKAFFKTNVIARDKDSRLTSDSLTYFRNEQITIAMGRVEIQSYSDNMTIRGGRFESHKKKDYSLMSDRPVLVKFDTTSGSGRIDTLVVRSNVMEAFRGDSVKRVIATDSVQIVRAELASVAGLANFYTTGDSIQLRRSPIIWYQRTQISGDSINVYLKKRKLSMVHVLGTSAAFSQSDSTRMDKFDQISGEEMKLTFGDTGIERMDVHTQAISIYHLYDDSTANGLNKTSGDNIVMLWADKKLESIKVVGGIEGRYVPENLARWNEKEFSVAGFFWREDKPMLRSSDFATSGNDVNRVGKK